MANAQLRWQATDRAAFWVTGEYRGKSPRFDGNPDRFTGNTQREYQALGDLKAFTMLHLGSSYKVTDNVTLSANVYNLLDKNFDQYRAWTNEAGETVLGSLYYKTTSATKGTAAAGRTFWLNAQIDF